MADDKTLRGPQDRSRINLSEEHEIGYWTKELGISRDELKRLALKHNGSVKAVRKKLNVS